MEFQKKLTRAREELNKREVDIRRELAKIEKTKVEALKKIEEMKYSVHHDMEKIKHDITKAKELNTEAKARIISEITALKDEIEKKHADLRNTIWGKATST